VLVSVGLACRVPTQRHPLKLLLCFLACKLCVWMGHSRMPTMSGLLLFCSCMVQLAAVAALTMWPSAPEAPAVPADAAATIPDAADAPTRKRQKRAVGLPELWTHAVRSVLGMQVGALYLMGRLYMHWAAVSPAQGQLPAASPAAAAIHLPMQFAMTQFQRMQASQPISIPMPPVPSIPSPLQFPITPHSQRCCAPLPPAIISLGEVPVPAPMSYPAIILILILSFYFIPLMREWMQQLQSLAALRYWPLAVRWFYLQYMRYKVQRIRCQLLFRLAVHWFMAPFLPVFLQETRKEVISRMHKQGVYLKSAAHKHVLFPARRSTQFIRRNNPVSASVWHKRLLFTLTLLLSFCITAAAGGVSGLSGIAAAVLAVAASPLASLNLAYLAVADPGMAVGLACRAAKEKAQQSDLAARLAAVRSLASVADYRPDGALPPNPDATTARYTKDPVGQWTLGNHPGFTAAHHEQLHQMLLGSRDCFAYSLADLSGYLGAKFVIELTHDRPIKQKPRHHAPLEAGIQDDKCMELWNAHMLRHADPSCKYASNATMPAKKDADGNWTDFRFCIDYRQINEATVADLYALHLASDLFRAAGGAKYFSKIDMRAAFHQFEIDEGSQAASSFYWRNQLFSWRRLSFGMKNSSAFVQRQLDLQLGKANLRGFCSSFVDDLLIWSDTAEEHIEHLRQVFAMLRSCGLKAHPAKTILACESLEFLGFDIGPNGITPHAAKIAAVKALPVPTNVAELRSVLGFLGYYRSFVPLYSTLAAPLNALLCKDAVWDWQQQHQSAYDQIKEEMCREGAALKPLHPDRPILVYSDWSQHGIGAVLAQHDDDGHEYMVACISRSLNKHERAYSSWEGEALGGVWAIKSFREYLFGRRFTLVSDHQPLRWLMQSPNLTGKHVRWALSLADYDFTIVHRPGSQHQNVDVPSRFPLPRSFDPTGACLDPDFDLPVPIQSPVASPALLAVQSRVAGARPTVLHTAHAGLHSPAGCEHLHCNTRALTAAHTAANAQHSAGIWATRAAYWNDCNFLDVYPSHTDELLEGSMGMPSDAVNTAPESRCPDAADETCMLRASAADLVRAAAGQLRHAPREITQRLRATGRSDRWGICTAVTQLCTQRVGAALNKAGMGEGIVVYEPFGGIASGLEGVLANGFKVQRYLYSDTNQAACAVAQSRMMDLHYKYPHLFPLSAFVHAFDELPADVRRVDTQALVAAGAKCGEQWLVIAGWPCEDLSAAGNGKGLRGSRSGLFYDTLRIVGTLQQLQLSTPPAYILENTHMQSDNNHKHVRQEAFPAICAALGQPVALDAARCGAYAHRLRNFWSNIACPLAVQAVCDRIVREQGRHVQSVLDEGRSAPLAQYPQRSPWYRCNTVKHAPLEALPTLVAYAGSRAYRMYGDDPAKGMLRVAAVKLHAGVTIPEHFAEPNADERERIMGYATGCTAAPGVSEESRHELTGKAMDRHAVTRLVSVYNALSQHTDGLEGVACFTAAPLPAVCHRLMPELNERQLRTMYPLGVEMLESGGWVIGQPLGREANGGLPWPLDTSGLVKGAGLGYNSPLHDQGGVSMSGKQHRLSLFGMVEHEELPMVPEGDEVTFGPDAHRLGWPVGMARHVAAAQDDMWPAEMTTERTTASQRARQPWPGAVLGDCVTEYERLVFHTALAMEAEVVEQLGGVVLDVLEDSNVLQYLRENGAPPGAFSVAERNRVKHRARHYELNGTVVVRMMADGTRRIVPPLDARVDLIQQTHAKTGHWGVRRTKALLLSGYWWQGLEKDVAKVLANCEVCSQVKATFNVADPQLHSLPIGGMMHRWGVDLAGPFTVSSRGNEYVMVCIEHFTKHIELIAIPDKSAETTAYAFLSHVLGRFGSCAEVITDQGSEFLGAFHQLLEESMIDHRTTSANHPQADGLAERCVQSVKMALSKCVLDKGSVQQWDEQLHWIALGYRASKQAASGFSPYTLLYGSEPCIPPAVKDRYRPGFALFFDTPDHQEQAAQYVLMRAKLLQDNCSIAMTNLRSAQHRDTLRYRQVRSGLYRPSLFKFNVGDYVYVRRRNVSNTLMSEARPGIFRCLEVRDSGVLVLQGKCGSTMEVNQENCAPCMLMNIDGRLDHSLRVPGADEPCVVCDSADDESIMLLCDGCGKGYHTYCLMPPLDSVPDSLIWICPTCEADGVQLQPLLEQRLAADAAEARPNQALLFPNAAQRAADSRAAQLDGQAVMFQLGGHWKKGTFQFVQRAHRPLAFARRPIRLKALGGHKQWLTEASARKLLLAGEGRPMIAAVAVVSAPVVLAGFVAAAAVRTTTVQPAADRRLPAGFDFSTVGGCQLAGEHLFPEGLSAAEAAQLYQGIQGAALHAPAPPADVQLFTAQQMSAGIATLLGSVDIRSCQRICCPCASFGASEEIGQALMGRYGIDLIVPGEAQRGSLVLSPAFYQAASRRSPWEWVFVFVPPGLEELALSIAVHEACIGVAMLCHSSFVTSGHGYRQRLLQGYMDEARLAVVSSPGQEYVWVCVFATAGHLGSMCNPPRIGAFCAEVPLVSEWDEGTE
jgi:transposase InsO family protein